MLIRLLVIVVYVNISTNLFLEDCLSRRVALIDGLRTRFLLSLWWFLSDYTSLAPTVLVHLLPDPPVHQYGVRSADRTRTFFTTERCLVNDDFRDER